jgi:hypothetical protein
MTNDEQQANSERSNRKAAHHCLALTPRVLSDLQVCLSSVELLEGLKLPAEAHLPLLRLSRAIDALVAAATAARLAASIEDRLFAGRPAKRS